MTDGLASTVVIGQVFFNIVIETLVVESNQFAM